MDQELDVVSIAELQSYSSSCCSVCEADVFDLVCDLSTFPHVYSTQNKQKYQLHCKFGEIARVCPYLLSAMPRCFLRP